MKSGARPRGHPSPIAVGVYDEPELIVSGVNAMLARCGSPVDVVTMGPDTDVAEVDVLLCDPVGHTIQIEEYLTTVASLTKAPVLVFTWSSSPSSLRRSLAAGARGFLSKGASSHDLASAVETVARGETMTPTKPRLAGTPTGVAEL